MLIKAFGKELFEVNFKGTSSRVIPTLDQLMDAYDVLRDTDKVSLSNVYNIQTWVNSIVNTISSNIARAPFKLYSDMEHTQEITSGVAYDFFLNVNQFLSRFQLWEGSMIFKLIRGESFWFVERAGSVLNMRFLEPFKMKAVIKNKELIGWVYRTRTGSIPFDIEEIVQFKYFNVLDNSRGLSPAGAAMKSINIDYSAQEFNEKLLKNGVNPSAVVEVESEMSPESYERLKMSIEKRHRGSKNSGKLLLLEGGAKYQGIGITPAEAQYMEQRKWTKDEIHAVYRVNSAVTGDTSAFNRANLQEIDKDFWIKRLIPEMTSIEDVLRTDFFPRYFPGESIYGAFDLSVIPELREDFASNVETGAKLWGMGFTANEINKRLKLGFEDKKWREFAYAPLSLVPVGSVPVVMEEDEPKEIDINNMVDKLAGFELKEIKQPEIPLFDKNKAKKELIELATPFYEGAIVTGGDLALQELGIEGTYQIVNEDSIRFFNTQKANIAKILDTVELNLELSIETGIREGQTLAQIADGLRHTMNITSNRAKTIAQTEVIGSANGGRISAYSENGVEKKEWINSYDDLVRIEHQFIEVVLLDSEFQNGLKFPGDRTGSGSLPGNIINCRCTVGAVVGKLYSSAQKERLWKLFVNQMDPQINKLTKALQKFFFALRQEVIGNYFQNTDTIEQLLNQ